MMCWVPQLYTELPCNLPTHTSKCVVCACAHRKPRTGHASWQGCQHPCSAAGTAWRSSLPQPSSALHQWLQSTSCKPAIPPCRLLVQLHRRRNLTRRLDLSRRRAMHRCRRRCAFATPPRASAAPASVPFSATTCGGRPTGSLTPGMQLHPQLPVAPNLHPLFS